MALYRNITDRAVYICCEMTKILIQPGATVELSARDLCHAGYALASFESVAKAKEVEDKRMADLARAERFAVKPVEVKPEPVPEPVVKKAKKEKPVKPEVYEVSKEAVVSEIEADFEKTEPVMETEAQTI